MDEGRLIKLGGLNTLMGLPTHFKSLDGHTVNIYHNDKKYSFRIDRPELIASPTYYLNRNSNIYPQSHYLGFTRKSGKEIIINKTPRVNLDLPYVLSGT